VNQETDLAPLPERLRLARKRLNLTQHELSRLCGFSVNQINRYETELREPSVTALKKLAQVLGVSMDYLAGLTDDMHGQLSPSELNLHENEIVTTFRNEGWPGVVRLSVDKITKPG
jgi:transcriptional regulator with XRE-family HTH domain